MNSEPSSRFQVMLGSGWPVARQDRLTLDPSRATTPSVVPLSTILGGTVLFAALLYIYSPGRRRRRPVCCTPRCWWMDGDARRRRNTNHNQMGGGGAEKKKKKKREHVIRLWNEIFFFLFLSSLLCVCVQGNKCFLTWDVLAGDWISLLCVCISIWVLFSLTDYYTTHREELNQSALWAGGGIGIE